MSTQVSQDVIRTKALNELAKLGGSLTTEDDVIFTGTKFVLPETCKGLKDAIKVLTRRMQDEEEHYSFSRTFPYRPWDGAAAADRAIRRVFGFSIGVTLRSFFGSQPPEMRTIPVGVNETIEVPWGQVALPGLDGAVLYFGATRDPELGQCFHVNVDAPRKYRKHIQGFLHVVDEELRERSIYRGKAIDGADTPNFIDVSAVTPDDVVYTAEVMRQLEANVWSPIRHASSLEALGQPGKRSVLFEGPYGTGKSLGAYLTAQVAQANGWTFLICRPGRDDLQETLRTARMYQPSVVFFEDLDTVSTAGDASTGDVTRILDSFDGIQTKGLKMLLVLTTNHVENIHKGMLRPGRLDAVIHIGAMDRAGVEKLVRRIVGDKLSPQVNFDAVFAAYDGFMPAFVREAIDRTVRYSVARNNGELSTITTEDLVLAASGLRDQLNLMEGASEETNRTTIDALVGDAVAKRVDNLKLVNIGGHVSSPTYDIRLDTEAVAKALKS